MTNLPKYCRSILRYTLRRTSFALMLLCAVTSVALSPARAQTFSVIHNFSGGQDGATPSAGLTMDKAGNFYGTTFSGGGKALGAIYRLKRSGSRWVADGLYSFLGGASDGAQPLARVIFGPDGSLYGTTSLGGPGQFCSLGCGIVYQLRPPATFCRSVTCPWTETILHFFGAYPDGFFPTGELIFDEAGNLYGTTDLGGVEAGIVYELTPSGNDWTESILHSFSGQGGYEPYGGLISDNAGNLYGTTQDGGLNYAGTVFRLTYSGSGWTESLPHIFQLADGGYPTAGLVLPLGQPIRRHYVWRFGWRGSRFRTVALRRELDLQRALQLHRTGWLSRQRVRRVRPLGGSYHGCSGQPIRHHPVRRRQSDGQHFQIDALKRRLDIHCAARF